MCATPYTQPGYDESAFNCPICDAYAQQSWKFVQFSVGSGITNLPYCKVAFCARCKNYSIWHDKKLVYPRRSIAPLPNPDLPEDIKADYEEAGSILEDSPRGAAALLRLSIEKLCKHLGGNGKDLNEDIGKLVEKGLPEMVQKALDAVRVIGNEAVHPGQIDLRDDRETASTLFDLVNLTCDYMITQPKRVHEIYGRIPSGKRGAIQQRDGKPE